MMCERRRTERSTLASTGARDRSGGVVAHPRRLPHPRGTTRVSHTPYPLAPTTVTTAATMNITP
jgi:hypothetical protein